jgi:hypothetical protein
LRFAALLSNGKTTTANKPNETKTATFRKLAITFSESLIVFYSRRTSQAATRSSEKAEACSNAYVVRRSLAIDIIDKVDNVVERI